jgi:hypothetical protein
METSTVRLWVIKRVRSPSDLRLKWVLIADIDGTLVRSVPTSLRWSHDNDSHPYPLVYLKGTLQEAVFLSWWRNAVQLEAVRGLEATSHAYKQPSLCHAGLLVRPRSLRHLRSI